MGKGEHMIWIFVCNLNLKEKWRKSIQEAIIPKFNCFNCDIDLIDIDIIRNWFNYDINFSKNVLNYLKKADNY